MGLSFLNFTLEAGFAGFLQLFASLIRHLVLSNGDRIPAGGVMGWCFGSGQTQADWAVHRADFDSLLGRVQARKGDDLIHADRDLPELEFSSSTGHGRAHDE